MTRSKNVSSSNMLCGRHLTGGVEDSSVDVRLGAFKKRQLAIWVYSYGSAWCPLLGSRFHAWPGCAINPHHSPPSMLDSSRSTVPGGEWPGRGCPSLHGSYTVFSIFHSHLKPSSGFKWGFCTFQYPFHEESKQGPRQPKPLRKLPQLLGEKEKTRICPQGVLRPPHPRPLPYSVLALSSCRHLVAAL